MEPELTETLSQENHIRINKPTSTSVKGRIQEKFNFTNTISYISIAVLIISILSVGQSSGQTSDKTLNAVSSVSSESVSNIDEVAAANLAAEVAHTTDISVKENVASRSVSLEARHALAQSSEEFAAKPMILADSLEELVVNYKVKAGDSLDSIASEYGVSKQTIKWANGIAGKNVATGKWLRIPTVDGIIYKVKSSDNADKLAKKYKAEKETIISFNNAEISGLEAGKQIVIPGGILPPKERPDYEAPEDPAPTPTSTYDSYAADPGSGSAGVNTGTFEASYSISYPFGWCTYYAAAKGGAPGNWGNANTWDDYAYQTPGWRVSSTPVVGAIAQRDTGWAGHVGIVEAVSADGTRIKYSDMNGIAGWGAVYSSGWVSAGEFSSYIYR